MTGTNLMRNGLLGMCSKEFLYRCNLDNPSVNKKVSKFMDTYDIVLLEIVFHSALQYMVEFSENIW